MSGQMKRGWRPIRRMVAISTLHSRLPVTRDALENCIGATRPGGRIVQVGILPARHSSVPMNRVVAKELELVGTFLSHEEFRWAVDALVHGRIDIGPILSGEFSLADAISAFELASDRSKAMKMSLVA